jgi:hypothetical protein
MEHSDPASQEIIRHLLNPNVHELAATKIQ